jgi:hypothetical protein
MHRLTPGISLHVSASGPGPAPPLLAGLLAARLLPPRVPGWLLLPAFLLGIVACDTSTSPGPVTPAQLQKVSGDGQEVNLHAELADSLVVRVVDGNGRPLSGVPVAWSAAKGVVEEGSVTDANGLASATWYVNFPGLSVATATVDGVVPAHFGARGRFLDFSLVGFSLNVRQVDVSGGPAALHVEAWGYAQEGVGDIVVYLVRPDGSSTHLFMELKDGTPEHGAWGGSFEIPQGAPSGEWTVRVTLAGPAEEGCHCLGYPRVTYPSSALSGQGFDSTVEVTGGS